jgi:defect in organelle trafficking protein DotA
VANLFNFAANEMSSGSLYYLGSIFGPVGTVLPGSGPGLLGTMFRVFNTATLALGTIIITYTTIVSVVMTAHEGEMLGKKFHTLWIPLRTVFGISALVPTATGYSYLQMAMMWFIIQGVGAADTLWTTTWNYIQQGGSTAPAPPGAALVNTAVQAKLGMLFESLVCQAAEKASGITSSSYLCGGSSPPGWCQQSDTDMLSVTPGSPQVSDGSYKMGVAGECGSVQVTTANSDALQVIVPALAAVASQFVAMDAAYSAYVNSTQVPPPPVPTVVQNYCNEHSRNCTPDSLRTQFPTLTPGNPADTTVKGLYWAYGVKPMADGFLDTAAALYANMMNNAQAANANENATGSQVDNGWIFAGAYYYDIAKTNRRATSVQVPDVAGPNNPQSLPTKANLLYNAATTLVLNIPSTTSSAPTSSGPIPNVGCSLWMIPVGSFCSSMISGWIGTLSGSNQNPLVAAQSFGGTLLDVVGIVYPILLAITLGVAIGMNLMVLGNGDPSALLSIQLIVLPPLYFFAMVFMALGATLAVYTPMIPFMLFTFGAVNWLIAAIETMIAAPIVAIGFLYPEGAHELWGKAEAAIMLILNIFLRPSLMIFGLISAMLLSYVSITLLNKGFMYAIGSVTSGNMGFLEVVFFMVLYTTIFTTMLGKCFELIHVIPDKILRWIGGGNEQFGSGGQELDKIGQGFKAEEEKISGAMKGLEQGIGGAGKGKAEGKAGAAKDKAWKAEQMKSAQEAAKKKGLKGRK